jgi:TMEM175 potassium channel family protein
MGKGRLEAFSDGVLAIIITIMVLELRVPHGVDGAEGIEALTALRPVFGSYVLSFVFIAIYWNNHHHMLHASEKVNGAVLWANVHLLFWLSLVPFVTAWMGENHFATVPVSAYGVVLLMCGVAFTVLARTLVRLHGPHSALARALGRDMKGRMSMVLYGAAIPLAFVSRWISLGIYIGVAALWLIPDRRIERTITHSV